MRRIPLLLTAAFLLGSAVPVLAQWPLNPTVSQQPQSNRYAVPGYDPFRLNWATGRFDYVPIPYARESVGTRYDPYRYNWYTGRWDYEPAQPPRRIAQLPFGGGAVVPIAPSPYEPIHPPQQLSWIQPAFDVPIPQDGNYLLRRALMPTTAPTTAPVERGAGGASERSTPLSSAAATKRPSTAPGMVGVDR